MTTQQERVIDTIAKLIVRSNIESYTEYTSQPTAEEFKTYGTCDETVLDILKYHLDEVVKRVEVLQSEIAELLYN